jgi:molybdenum cofactor biosynthesis enzyme
VQVAPVLKPVIVVTNGVASDAEPEVGEGVPLLQVTLTDTEAPLFGMKSLFTVSVALFSVLVMVQEAEPPTVIKTLAQLA